MYRQTSILFASSLYLYFIPIIVKSILENKARKYNKGTTKVFVTSHIPMRGICIPYASNAYDNHMRRSLRPVRKSHEHVRTEVKTRRPNRGPDQRCACTGCLVGAAASHGCNDGARDASLRARTRKTKAGSIAHGEKRT